MARLTARRPLAGSIELAYAAGAPDNVTCVLADVAEVSAEPSIDDTAEAYVVGAAAEGGSNEEAFAYRLAAAEAYAGERDDEERQVDPEALRYAPRQPGRLRWLRRGLLVGVAAALIWAVGSWAYGWSQRQYYVVRRQRRRRHLPGRRPAARPR